MASLVREISGAASPRDLLLSDYLASRSLTPSSITDALSCHDSEILFASGSALDGVGDADSDIDVYLLTSREAFERRAAGFDRERRGQQQRLDFGIIYFNLAGQEVDTECHLIDKYEALLDALDALEPLSRQCLWENFRTLGRLERSEAVELLHRFRIASPLHGHQRFAKLRSRLDDGKFLAWNAHFHLIEAEDFIKGVKRSLRNGDAENAHLKLMRLLDSVADASLFLAGESLDRWKWRLPKLRRTADPEFLAFYLDVQLGRYGAAGLRAGVAGALERAEETRQRLHQRLQPSA